MKKTYIAPEMEVMNIETVEMIATSFVKDDENTFNTNGEDEGVQAGNDRRGTWGNLWN